jgi:hypothetical protein
VEDDMAVDTMLWVLVAAGAGLIWFGCIMTAGTNKPANLRGDRFGH